MGDNHPKIDLSIIIVSWNVRQLLEKCLSSIFKHTQGINFEVFVVDNASHDNSSQMVSRKFPQVKLIANTRNLGFATANNLAIQRSCGRYILLLNPDTELFNNALAEMVSLMDGHNQWALAGCKIFNPDKTLQTSVRRFSTLKDQLLILFKLHHLPLFKKALNHYLAKDFDYQCSQPVDQIMGAFFIFRRQVLDRIGPLDDKYFYWFEEVDYCQRAHQAGLKVFYTPQAAIIHHGASSFKQLDWRKQLIWNHSLQRYFWKHKPKYQWFILWLLQPLSLLIALLAWFWKK